MHKNTHIYKAIFDIRNLTFSIKYDTIISGVEKTLHKEKVCDIRHFDNSNRKKE